ncbi:sacsin N-terminal ATP-binding-like domain-containing protein [Pengzhenrongella sicca]|uniref:ATP-binding protein n=1 Tax=Pengzhenrongella sicca TaxID=2819238 RepID=A0A8A4ZFX0_9MICO|nr:ATP-binding protein [Pengzhenrongella sicca]QTE29843.1 ATP-binding protein [Pengzhenrongella sicca]
MTPDAFGTAALRGAVLQAWAASPARLREDANTEEDHARGYYRDRVVVELAQNAADAATRAGVDGHLLLRLAEADGRTVLVAANTGAPLDADGVASLASLRASAKRDGRGATSPVGRFGVGFAAVRSVADEVSVRSTAGGVRFSLAATAAELAALAPSHPALAAEVRRREGSLPALRLPRPDAERPPAGYDTAVVLELRDGAAVAQVRALLAEVRDPLLLALPALTEIVIEIDLPAQRSQHRIADVGARWTIARGAGTLDLVLLADRPVEERTAREWSVTWALPRRAGAPGGFEAPAERGAQEWGGVVHAPTPTDERSALPALLVATLPLDPSRRHVARGPLTDAVLERAADVYADLARGVAEAGGDPLALVPLGLPAGALDGDLSELIVARLSAAPLLAPPPAATFDTEADPTAGTLIEPRRAVALAGEIGRDPAAIGALARWAANLVVLGPGQEAPARVLGVELRELADLIEELPTAAEPAHWHALYAALAPAAADPAVREALGALPVLLADGRVVRGARGLVLPAPSAGAGPGAHLRTLDVLARWGLRLVDPAVAHPLLERLGAAAPEPGGLLLLPAVREAVLEVAADDDLDLADDVADAVLTLVAGALADGHVPAQAAGWLAELTLRDAADEPTPAAGLVLGGSVAAQLLDDRVLAPVGDEFVERWGAAVLAAVGVRDHLALVRVADLLVEAPGEGLLGEPGDELATRSLDGWDDYLELLAARLGAGVLIGELTAVADLDAVRDDAWPAVLGHLAADPDLRRALLEPVRADGDLRARSAPSYTAWWLRGRTPAALGLGDPFALAGAPHGLRELLAPVPSGLVGLDPAVLGALGGVQEFGELDGEAWADLLDELGPVGTPVDPDVAVTLWRALADAAAAEVELDRVPERLPALVGPGQVRMVHADDAAVAPQPMWLQRPDVAALVPAPAALAARLGALLDLPLADDLGDDPDVDAPDAVDPDGSIGPTPDAALALVPGAPRTWLEHDDLHAGGAPVDWWVEGTGSDAVVHATQLAALARGLAQAAGRWELRHALELALTEPDRAAELRTEAAFDR